MDQVTPAIGDRHAVVLRMFNERSSSWKITDERIDALASSPSGLEEQHSSTIASMVDAAIEGGKIWTLTTERYIALRQYLLMVRVPASQDVKDIVRRMQVGGMSDGVADKEWFVEAMKVLAELSNR